MIDPLTGLPADALASDAYQIPLDSNPALAPEWSPQGRPPFALFPDNIVPTFATLQAQNSKDKKNVQAATTDGLGNLNVNIAGGGGGGVSPLAIPDPQGEQQLVLGGGETDFVEYPMPAYVLGIQFCWRWTAFSTSAGLYIGSLILTAQGHGIGSLPICFSYAASQIGGIAGGIYNWFLPEPLDVSGWSNTHPPNLRIGAWNNSNANKIAVEMNPFFG